MKKLLNTLYVSTQGIYLHLDGETLSAEKEKQVVMRLPLHTISGIVCFGNVLCSPFLMGKCAQNGIHISFLNEHGSFLARLEGEKTGNVFLRIEQVKKSMNPDLTAKLARNFVIGKVLNSRTILQRRLRDHGTDIPCETASVTLANIVRQLKECRDVDTIRGFEGEAANAYFSAFNSLLLDQKKDFMITNRNRRPPLDPMNSLLSFLYTLLAHDCEGACKGVGLDAQIGFLHALRPGRASLALDLMEEFRAVICDRLALTLVNLKQLQKKDFISSESGAVIMKDSARKELLSAWQKRKQDEIIHPFLKEKVKIGLLPHVQALLLSRYLRGDLDDYPPFILK